MSLETHKSEELMSVQKVLSVGSFFGEPLTQHRTAVALTECTFALLPLKDYQTVLRQQNE